MSNIILFDGASRDYLLPLTYSRPVAGLRVGILTIAEKWEKHLRMPASFLTQDYLEGLFPLHFADHNILINGNVLPSGEIVARVLELNPGEAYLLEGELIAACLDRTAVEALAADNDFGEFSAFELEGVALQRVERPADIFGLNSEQIVADFSLVTEGRKSAKLSATNTLIGPKENLFVEAGARIEACIINVEDGPVYFGKDCIVLEGCMLRSPLAVGEGALLKMGAKIYGGTTLGPQSKAGGEVNNVVFQGNCNKGHDGFLGNAVVGEWCNIGADTNCSNLRNDYAEVKVWSYPEERFVKCGKQFHGVILADHAKVGINTMFNTGSVVGFAANVFGEGFPRTFIPSYSWGGSSGYMTYRMDKALATARRVMDRRGVPLTAAHEQMFTAIFKESARWRRWEKKAG